MTFWFQKFSAIIAELAAIDDCKLRHCVVVYDFDVSSQTFKVKDSHAVKYEIAINRPDCQQV